MLFGWRNTSLTQKCGERGGRKKGDVIGERKKKKKKKNLCRRGAKGKVGTLRLGKENLGDGGASENHSGKGGGFFGKGTEIRLKNTRRKNFFQNSRNFRG